MGSEEISKLRKLATDATQGEWVPFLDTKRDLCNRDTGQKCRSGDCLERIRWFT